MTTSESFPCWSDVVAGQTVSVGDADMVLAYTTPDDEYRALRQEAGHYDLDGCGRLRVSGPGALELVQQMVTREIQYLLPEACLMALVLDGNGAILDVVTVFVGEEGAFELQPSLGAASATGALLRSVAHEFDAVEVQDLAPAMRAIAIEGPATWTILEKIGLEQVIDLPFQGVRTTMVGNRRARVARTGVTGEFGVQVMADAAVVDGLLDQLAPLCPRVGMLALEAAMLDVRHPNLQRECRGVGVGQAGLQWLVDVHKEDFLGRGAVFADVESAAGSRVGFAATCERGLPGGSPLTTREGESVGVVVWSTYSPGRRAWTGVAEVRREICVPGLRFGAKDAAGDDVVVETVSCPFVVPGSWAVVAAERAIDLSGGEPG